MVTSMFTLTDEWCVLWTPHSTVSTHSPGAQSFLVAASSWICCHFCTRFPTPFFFIARPVPSFCNHHKQGFQPRRPTPILAACRVRNFVHPSPSHSEVCDFAPFLLLLPALFAEKTECLFTQFHINNKPAPFSFSSPSRHCSRRSWRPAAEPRKTTQPAGRCAQAWEGPTPAPRRRRPQTGERRPLIHLQSRGGKSHE